MAADTATRPSSETGAWDAPSANVAGGAGSRKPAAILAVAAFAAFLATFNETFLNVGFAPIMADLAVDVSTVQWLATAYMLGAAVMVPVSAFAYRSFPTRASTPPRWPSSASPSSAFSTGCPPCSAAACRWPA